MLQQTESWQLYKMQLARQLFEAEVIAQFNELPSTQP